MPYGMRITQTLGIWSMVLMLASGSLGVVVPSGACEASTVDLETPACQRACCDAAKPSRHSCCSGDTDQSPDPVFEPWCGCQLQMPLPFEPQTNTRWHVRDDTQNHAAATRLLSHAALVCSHLRNRSHAVAGERVPLQVLHCAWLT